MATTTNLTVSLRACRLMVLLVSMGTNTIDPADAGPLFSMRIPLPLPERDFIP